MNKEVVKIVSIHRNNPSMRQSKKSLINYEEQLQTFLQKLTFHSHTKVNLQVPMSHDEDFLCDPKFVEAKAH